MGSDNKSNGSGDGGRYGDGGEIPASAKKVVQNLKEIVKDNCTDSEIYAVLRDCDMDPNDAVQRLLSQDTFHEVKSRRERRKEMKESQELKARANNGTYNRGGSVHNLGWNESIQISTNELSKAAFWDENGSATFIPYSAPSTLCSTGQALNEQPSPQSNSLNADNRRQAMGRGDMIDLSLLSSTGSQSATPGNVTMADIVRMGRPLGKGSQMPSETSTPQDDAVRPTIDQMKFSLANSASHYGTHQDLHSNLNMTGQSGKNSSEHDCEDGLPVDDSITASRDIGAMMYSNQSYIHSNISHLSDNILASESNASRENLNSGRANSAQAFNKQIFNNDFGGTSKHDNDLRTSVGSPDSYQKIHEPQEVSEVVRVSNISVPNPTPSLSDAAVKPVSSAAKNLQQLILEERAVTPTEDNGQVMLPKYLQAFSADCSHLSFGTYKSGQRQVLFQPQASNSMTNDLEETLTTSIGFPSFAHLKSRDLGYQDAEQLEFDFDAHRAFGARNYNRPILSQAKLKKTDIPDATAHGDDYVSHLSIPGARNLPPLTSEVKSYLKSIPSDVLAATIQSMKASDSAAFPVSQPISLRYSSSAPSFKDPTASISEVLNSGAFSVSHPSQALLGSNPAIRLVPEEQLLAHSYSRTRYPAVLQGHTYMPSALQQSYPDGNLFSESYSGIEYNVPQYRNGSFSSLPFSDSFRGYQRFANFSDIRGSFPDNRIGYNDFLRSQHRNEANLNQLQQDYGNGSRTRSTIQDDSYYSLLGQNQLFDGYRSGQRRSQLHGGLGYPDNHNSQARISIEELLLQQQNLGNMTLNGSQGQSSKQPPKFW